MAVLGAVDTPVGVAPPTAPRPGVAMVALGTRLTGTLVGATWLLRRD